MKLNDDNYFSPQASKLYCSASQYKSFLVDIPNMSACEERTLAEIDEKWQRDTTDSLLLGSFVDCMLLEPDKLDKFTEEHQEMFSTRGATKGQLKAQYQNGIKMVEKIKQSELFMKFINNSKHQEIMTGNIAGQDFKIKIDGLGEKFIFDLKTTADITKEYWINGERTTYIKAWGYHYQGAIYREIVRQNTGKTLPFIIGAVENKKQHQRLDIAEIPSADLDETLEEIKMSIPLIKAIKSGAKKPCRCEKCDYCADTQVITKIGDWLKRDLVGEDDE